ncbi:MAG: ComEC/Rec2 family competence protein [Planctomycetes bacterium]|nr:ComEC/Rec2 family competence protein [Planctomycetota bacterium]
MGSETSIVARAKPRRPALLAGGAAVAGCAVAAWLPDAGPLKFAALALAVLLVIATALLRKKPQLRAWVIACAVAAAFTAWASWRAAPAPGALETYFPADAELVRIEGVIVEGGDYVRRDPAAFEYPEAPEPQGGFPVGADTRRNVSYLLEVHGLPDLGENASGFVKLYAHPDTRLTPGSRVRVIGKLRQPRRAGNPGEVDSLAMYRQRGITHTMTLDHPGHAIVVAEPAWWSPHALAYAVHVKFHELVGARMARDRAAILGATLLGERGNLSHDQRAKFVRSGTVHLLVVSGLHVGLLAGAVVLFLRILGLEPRKAWAIGAAIAVVYLFVTGLQPSVLRATVMLVVYALGRVLSRRPDALNVLGASALVSLAISPRDVAELGFQLSYLSVLGIFVFAPAFKLFKPLTPSERATRGISGRAMNWLGGSGRASLGVGVCTWPLLVYTVHVFSPVMVASNLFAAPLLALMLVLGLLTPLAAIPGLGAVLAWALSLLAGLLDALAGGLAAVPYGHLFLPAPPLWWLAGYYALLPAMMLAPRLRIPRVAGVALWLMWLCILPATTIVSGDGPGPVRMTALDVGQGQCVVIEVPDGPCVVLDCGSTSLGAAGERVLSPYLWTRRRSHIDVLIISHADADHVNGLPQLLERFDVGVVYVGETFADDETGAALLAWLSARAEVRLLKRGDELELAPKLRLRCLWPDVAWAHGLMNAREQRNDAGLVLELQAGPTRVLLPSDVETRGLAGVLPLVPRAHVLFAPHQGSAVDGLPDILRQWQPAHVVVSARESFPADSAMRAYAASGAELWTTWQHGAITLQLGADGGIEVVPWLGRSD